MFRFWKKKKANEEVHPEIKEAEETPAFNEELVEKKEVDGERKEAFTSPYPFTDCSPEVLTAYANSVHNANEGRLLINEMEKNPLDYIFDLLCFTFKLLEISYGIDVCNCRFCDLMGLHLQVGIIAASFPFKRLLSFELDEDLASDALHRLRSSTFGDKSCPVTYEIGFFKDHVDLFEDFEMLYLDCNILGPFLDEGMILKIAFQCFKVANPGTILLLLTRQSPSVDFDSINFKVLLRKKHTPNGTIGNFWLCQKII